ncbi:hypothetical protein Hdeb2414_s0007g00253931 [Helianthus debilis subsp. tardiflorus]
MRRPSAKTMMPVLVSGKTHLSFVDLVLEALKKGGYKEDSGDRRGYK